MEVVFDASTVKLYNEQYMAGSIHHCHGQEEATRKENRLLIL